MKKQECLANSKNLKLNKCQYTNRDHNNCNLINSKLMNSKCYKINDKINYDLDDENEKTKDFDKNRCKKMNYQKKYDCEDCALPNVLSYKKSETKFCQIYHCENGFELKDDTTCEQCNPKDANGIYLKNSCKLEKCKAGFVLNSNKTKCITCSNNNNFVEEWKIPGQDCTINKCKNGSMLEKINFDDIGKCIKCVTDDKGVLNYLCNEPKYWDTYQNKCLSNLNQTDCEKNTENNYNPILRKCIHVDTDADSCERNLCSTEQCRVESCKNGYKLKDNQCNGCPKTASDFKVIINYSDVASQNSTQEKFSNTPTELKSQCKDYQNNIKTTITDEITCLKDNNIFGFERDNCYDSSGNIVDLSIVDNPNNETLAQLCYKTPGNYYGKNKCTKDNTEFTYQNLCKSPNVWNDSGKKCYDSDNKVVKYSELCRQKNNNWDDIKINYTKLGLNLLIYQNLNTLKMQMNIIDL